jgi:hypothetical protein
LCWAACILLLPPHGLVLETYSRSRSIEKMDDKESLTPNRLLGALGRKSPNPERRQLWLFFSTSEPHHQNPSVSIFLQGGKASGDGFCRDRLRGCSRQVEASWEYRSLKRRE